MHRSSLHREPGRIDVVATDVLAAVLAVLPSPVVAIDGAGRIVAVSPQGAQVFGAADAAALVGADLGAHLGADALAWAQSGAESTRAFTLRGLDGAVRHVTGERMEGADGLGESGEAVQLISVRLDTPAPDPDAMAEGSEQAPEIPPVLIDSPVGVIVTRRADGVICAVNGAFLDIVGRSRADIIGNTAVGIGLWTSPEERRAHLDAMSDPEAARCEVGRIRHGGGGTRDVRVWKHAAPGSGGEAAFLLTLVIGDDRRTAAEGALNAERDFTRAILDTSGQSIVIADGDDRLVYANTAFADLTGRPLRDLLGHKVGEVISPDARDAYETELTRRRSGERGVYEICIAHADGTERAVLITAIPHPSGEVGASIALITDLTAIRAAQREAETQRAFYEDLVGRLPVSIVLLDADWRFQFANAEAIRDDGLRAWSTGHTFEEIAAHANMPEGRLDFFKQAKRRLMETGDAVEWIEEVQERLPDGTPGEARHLLQRLEPLVSPRRGGGGLPSGYLGYAIDVTERVRTERIVDEARAFYETILGELPIPLVVFEADGCVLYVNPAVAPRPEARARLVGKMLPERIARLMGVQGDGRDRLHEVAATGQRLQWEETRTRAGHPPRHLLASLVPIIGPDGAVEHIVGYSVDVTAQHEGRLAVDRTKAYYERILRRLPIELYIVRPDGTFDFLNPAAVRDAETRAWLVGRRNADYARIRGFDEAPFAARDAWVQSVIEDPREATREETLDLPDRPTCHMLRALLPVFGDSDEEPGGDLAFLIGYGVDLTERTAAARQQEAQRAFYESVLDHLPLSVAVFDANGRVLYISPQAVPEAHLRSQMLGKTNTEMARLRKRPLGNARARDAWLRGVLDGDGMRTIEERVVYPSGDVREVLRTAVPVMRADGDGVDYVVGYTIDQTERKRYEASLLAAKEQAEELGRLKTTFLANMSHEVRTPLAGIIGFAEVLLDEVDEPHREAAQLIRQSGVRLLDTLNSVLDLARLEANAVELHLTRLDVAAETEAARRLLAAMAAPQRLPLIVEVPSEPAFAFLDTRAYHRVLVNLVSNAVKFTDEGEVRVIVSIEDGEVVVRVRDTGIGMDAAFLPYVFAEFRQESGGLTRSHQGSGLGLAITRHLVGLMHGRIEVESEKGVGSTFTVRFPFAG